jgi:hypothetical protein
VGSRRFYQHGGQPCASVEKRETVNLYAVEMKIIGTFSTYIQAGSQHEAEQLVKDRAKEMNPDSVVFESIAYRMEPCEHCGEEHFGPVCAKLANGLIRPSWERERL